MEKLFALCREIGFDHFGPLCPGDLRFLPEVREMCAADRCRSYGRSWTCPPHCGTLEEAAAQAKRFTQGLLVQTTGTMEDDFDLDCMMDTEQRHKEHFSLLADRVQALYPGCLPMGCGTCTLCDTCTCPDSPCRFPDRAIPSMEAYGLLVSQVCEKAGLAYYYGPRTITYTSCILFHREETT